MPRTAEQEAEILSKIESLFSPYYLVPHCSPIHDINHVKRVLAIAEKIIDPRETDLFLLKTAIWMHNFDRSDAFGDWLHFNGIDEDCLRESLVAAFMVTLSNFTEDERAIIILSTTILKKFEFDKNEMELIVDAVLKHNKLNDEHDSPLLRDLKDADRLDEGAIGILRLSGPNERPVPLYTSDDFAGLTRSTKERDLTSILHDIDRCLEWEAMLRNPRAKELGVRRFAFMRTFRYEVYRELRELQMI